MVVGCMTLNCDPQIWKQIACLPLCNAFVAGLFHDRDCHYRFPGIDEHLKHLTLLATRNPAQK